MKLISLRNPITAVVWVNGKPYFMRARGNRGKRVLLEIKGISFLDTPNSFVSQDESQKVRFVWIDETSSVDVVARNCRVVMKRRVTHYILE